MSKAIARAGQAFRLAAIEAIDKAVFGGPGRTPEQGAEAIGTEMGRKGRVVSRHSPSSLNATLNVTEYMSSGGFMFEISQPWCAFVRLAMIFFLLLLHVRLCEKRTIEQFPPSGLLVVMFSIEGVSSSLSSGDERLHGDLIGAFMLVLLNVILAYDSSRNHKFSDSVQSEKM